MDILRVHAGVHKAGLDDGLVHAYVARRINTKSRLRHHGRGDIGGICLDRHVAADRRRVANRDRLGRRDARSLDHDIAPSIDLYVIRRLHYGRVDRNVLLRADRKCAVRTNVAVLHGHRTRAVRRGERHVLVGCDLRRIDNDAVAAVRSDFRSTGGPNHRVVLHLNAVASRDLQIRIVSRINHRPCESRRRVKLTSLDERTTSRVRANSDIALLGRERNAFPADHLGLDNDVLPVPGGLYGCCRSSGDPINLRVGVRVVDKRDLVRPGRPLHLRDLEIRVRLRSRFDGNIARRLDLHLPICGLVCNLNVPVERELDVFP